MLEERTQTGSNLKRALTYWRVWSKYDAWHALITRGVLIKCAWNLCNPICQACSDDHQFLSRRCEQDGKPPNTYGFGGAPLDAGMAGRIISDTHALYQARPKDLTS